MKQPAGTLQLETTSCRKGGLFAVSLNQSTFTPKGKGEAFKKQRRIIPLARNPLFIPVEADELESATKSLFHQLNAFDLTSFYWFRYRSILRPCSLLIDLCSTP